MRIRYGSFSKIEHLFFARASATESRASRDRCPLRHANRVETKVLYFAAGMAKCPLCSQRAAKRHCPAKAGKICSICCGTKREVEIDCPGDCVYLRKGRSFESSREHRHDARQPTPQFNQQFLYRNTGTINRVAQAILEERDRAPGMVDQDVRSALDALRATMKTLSSGIHYETLPEGSVASMGLYRRIKSALEQLMQPQGPTVDALRVSDIPELLDFLLVTAESRSSGRPRSRQYLDWLASVAPEPPPDEASRIIVP